MTKPQIKFLHLADIHLNRPPGKDGLNLPYDKKAKRRQESLQVFIRAMELAINEQVDLILISGDLWDEDMLEQKTVPFVFESINAVNVPVFIAPGNRDYFHITSHYSNIITRARYNKVWPSNVHIFSSPEFTHVIPRNLDHVCISGKAVVGREVNPNSRPFAKVIHVPDKPIRLALMHGSREQKLPPGKTSVNPFADHELLAQSFDYVALGHYHNLSIINDETGKIRAAYPGAACSNGVYDKGPCGAVIGVVEPGGIAREDFEFNELDDRRVVKINLDVTGCRHVQHVEKTILEGLKKSEARPVDMVMIELYGTFYSGSHIAFGEMFLQDAFFHLQIDTSAVRPEWALELSDENSTKTTEVLFQIRMQEMLKGTIGKGDEKKLSQIQNAMYYGLDALYGSPVTPRET